MKYTIITTVILIGIALGLALVVQEAARWNSFLRTAFLVPSALGLASASLLFYALYAPQSGPFAQLLTALGIGDGTVSFLGTPNAALWSTVAVIVWRLYAESSTTRSPPARDAASVTIASSDGMSQGPPGAR